MNTIIFAPVYSRSGYGDHAREVVEFILNETTMKLSIVPTSWGRNQDSYYTQKSNLIENINKRIITKIEESNYDCCITVGMPTEFKTIGEYNIGITAGVETTRISKEFIYNANQMDLVIVPSEFTRTVFENTHYINDTQQELKLECEICVVNEFASSEFYEDTPSTKETSMLSGISEEFCFLSVGQWITSETDDGGRKNIKSLIRTFIDTFGGNYDKQKPALVLKTNGCNFSFTDKNNIERMIQEIIDSHNDFNRPNIYLVHGNLNTHEMHELYSDPKIKSYISHSRGEGFGRPLLESALCELPIICPNFGGYLDFLNKDNSCLIEGTLVDVGVTNNLFCENAKWTQIDESKSSSAMKMVYENYDKYKSKIVKSRRDIVTNFSCKSATSKYKHIFNNI